MLKKLYLNLHDNYQPYVFKFFKTDYYKLVL